MCAYYNVLFIYFYEQATSKIFIANLTLKKKKIKPNKVTKIGNKICLFKQITRSLQSSDALQFLSLWFYFFSLVKQMTAAIMY